jgi:hypothetical protein
MTIEPESKNVGLLLDTNSKAPLIEDAESLTRPILETSHIDIVEFGGIGLCNGSDRILLQRRLTQPSGPELLAFTLDEGSV